MATHLECISDIKFNSSFRNMLRDYYAYGFKDSADFGCSSSTYNNDRKRLNDILNDYMQWQDQTKRKSATSAGKKVTFITCDSQSMKINPFHRVYRFCGSNRVDSLYCFFHTLAALNNSFQLSEGTDTLGLQGDNAERLEDKKNVQEKQLDKTLKSMKVSKDIRAQLEPYYSDEEGLIKKAGEIGLSDGQVNSMKEIIQKATVKLKTSDLRRFYPQTSQSNSENAKSDNKTANNRLDRLMNLGVISCEQNGRNQSEKSLKDNTTTKKGDRNWYLSKLTLKRLIDTGKTGNDQFIEHLCYALDFYSKTFLFGEIGTYLLDRLRTENPSPIRIKHEYYMHSLNDFNAIDLMDAIEKKRWCLISYKREKVQTKLLCYPIELRISSTNGREYLMYYEPFKKSCTSLRLEFIESIQYCLDNIVNSVLSEYYGDAETGIGNKIDDNISRAKELMNYIWGVSTGKIQEENVEKSERFFQNLCLRIAYNKEEKKGFVLKKLQRESRIGKYRVNDEAGYIDFTVTAADINEAIPFIRRFYENIISCTGFEGTGFSIETDIQSIEREWGIKDKEEKEGIKKKGVEDEAANKDSSVSDEGRVPKKGVWGIDDKFLVLLDKRVNANAHEKLFHEVFSTFYHIFAAFFSEICKGISEDCIGGDSFTAKEIDDIRENIMSEFQDEYGQEMRWNSYDKGKVFVDLLKKGGFLVEENDGGNLKYTSKYDTSSLVDLYKDVIPLSELEIRWLKTIISDEKICYFFSDEELFEINSLLNNMAKDIKPFPMDAVNYYDRYKFSKKRQRKEGAVLTPVLDAIRKSHEVEIKYVSNKKNEESGDYRPILVEYSKRDNRFKGYFLSSKKERLKVYNLDQCISVADTGKQFDANESNAHYEKLRNRNMAEVRIQFDDKQNLADRVLTEFSPWKKQCEFDPESGVYDLTIYYQKRDGKELALRLLEFGPNIRMCDPEHKLVGIVRKKLRVQKERMQKQITEPMLSENKADRAR